MSLIKSFLCVISIFVTQLPGDMNTIEEGQETTINTYKEDLTGDGSNEIIKLKGVLLSKNQSFFHVIWLEITTETNKEYKIFYTGGYDPDIQFIKLPSFPGKSVFFTHKQEPHMPSESFLHSYDNKRIIQHKLPEPKYMSGEFLDDFAVQLSIDEQLEANIYPIMNIDVYKNLYTHDGKLKENINIMTKDISSFTPILVSTSKHYGLKSFQHVYNQKTHEVIGGIETLWYLENDQWIKLTEQWISI